MTKVEPQAMSNNGNNNDGDDFEAPPLQHSRTDRTINGQDPAWNERNLLSLDGGGIRGYWTLLVLERLMQEVGDEERRQANSANEGNFYELHSFLPRPMPPNVTQCPTSSSDQQTDVRAFDAERFLPCHYFDLICGSSTGSLIAIMLSRFRMTVKDCLQEYEKMSQLIFGNPRWISQRNIGIVRWPKYSAKAMEKAFKEVTKRRGQRPVDGADAPPPSLYPTKAGTCSMFATTFRRTKSEEASSRTLHLLRSYNHPKDGRHRPPWDINFGPAEQMVIWQVARAATAAPMYFKEIHISNEDRKKRIYYSDGGFGHTNNPTQLGIQELETLHRRPGSIGAIVSIGTARADDKPGGKGIFRRVKDAFSQATNPRTVAEAVEYQQWPHYWRLNHAKGTDMELDDWKPNKFNPNPGHKTLSLMKDVFNEWIANRDNRDMVQDCASELVKRRRARTADESKWERFATVAEFQCCHSDCHNSPIDYRHRFENHFKEEHSHLEDAVRYQTPGVTTWNYQGPPRSQS